MRQRILYIYLYTSKYLSRSHRRIHSDLLQSRDMLIDSDASLASTITKKIKCNGKSSHDLHYSSYSSQQRHCGLKRCPHHVALPDNEWDTVDSRLQLSNSYQVNSGVAKPSVGSCCCTSHTHFRQLIAWNTGGGAAAATARQI